MLKCVCDLFFIFFISTSSVPCHELINIGRLYFHVFSSCSASRAGAANQNGGEAPDAGLGDAEYDDDSPWTPDSESDGGSPTDSTTDPEETDSDASACAASSKSAKIARTASKSGQSRQSRQQRQCRSKRVSCCCEFALSVSGVTHDMEAGKDSYDRATWTLRGNVCLFHSGHPRSVLPPPRTLDDDQRENLARIKAAAGLSMGQVQALATSECVESLSITRSVLDDLHAAGQPLALRYAILALGSTG